MSFRGRLTLFFLLIVVLPMVVVVALLILVSNRSEDAKADARLDAGRATALVLYRDARAAAEKATQRLVRDRAVAGALRSGNRSRIEAIVRPEAAGAGLKSLVVRDAGGRPVAEIGSAPAVAPYELNLTGPGGALGSVTTSTATPDDYLGKVQRFTGRDGALLSAGEPISSTLPLNGADLPASGDFDDVEAGDEVLRAATVDLPGPGTLDLTLLRPRRVRGLLLLEPAGGRRCSSCSSRSRCCSWSCCCGCSQGQVGAMLDAAQPDRRGRLHPARCR